ncbi:hypothetical protein [Schlesneria paludicola]|uniref:hypothetical protein n=1 Tax=Schlesneria paludicola TaxID=360056 RepID=UPI000299ECEE|nr:hypothetical protein [Schlesneria paludicola]
MVEAKGSLKNRIQDLGNQASQAASSAYESVKSATETVGQRAQEFMADASKRAEEAGNYLNQRAEDATAAVGGQFKAAGDASASLAESLRSTGAYVQEEGFGGLEADLANLIKRNPIPAVLAGIGLGFMLARTLYHRS